MQDRLNHVLDNLYLMVMEPLMTSNAVASEHRPREGVATTLSDRCGKQGPSKHQREDGVVWNVNAVSETSQRRIQVSGKRIEKMVSSYPPIQSHIPTVVTVQDMPFGEMLIDRAVGSAWQPQCVMTNKVPWLTAPASQLEPACRQSSWSQGTRLGANPK